MGSSARPRPPAGLQRAGKRLFKRFVSDLPSDLELDARELLLLEQAARQADTVSALEEDLERSGLTTIGSRGQSRLNATVTELRQSRIALGRLLGELDLKGVVEPSTAASQRARKAADARWGRRAS